eukprot:7773929-Pyramimonas_sp.AAC.1
MESCPPCPTNRCLARVSSRAGLPVFSTLGDAPRLQWASERHAHAVTIATCMHGGALSQEEAVRQTIGQSTFNRRAWKESS